MRGMISNSEPHHAVRTLEKIRKLCSEADFRQALLVLRGSDIFKQNAIGRDFNRSFPRLVGPETGAVFSPNDIISKIHANIKKISELIEINKKIIEEISIANFPKAIENCRLLIDHDGASIASLRYLHFIKNHVAPGQDLAKEIDEILSQAKVENIRYISSVIRELSSGRTDYFNIIDRVTKADWSISVSIARTFIDFIPRSQREFATTFSSLYYISIFDAFLYLARLQTLELP